MIYTPQNCQKMLKGLKTNTRRLALDDQIVELKYGTRLTVGVIRSAHGFIDIMTWLTDGGNDQIVAVYHANGRLKWRIGKDYAFCPGRGEFATGRFELLKLRLEYVNDISEEDVLAEGVAPHTFAMGVLADDPPDPRWQFIELWDSLHTTTGHRWQDNPLVFALDFKVVGESGLI